MIARMIVKGPKKRKPKAPKAPKELVPSEHDEQVALIDYAKMRAAGDDRWDDLYATPNGGPRGDDPKARAIRGKILAAEGVKPGIPDLFLPVPLGDFHGLYVEMKKSVDGVVSKDQKIWIRKLKRRNYCVVVRRGFEPAKDFIEAYLAGKIRLGAYQTDPEHPEL